MEFCKKYNGRILEGEKLIWENNNTYSIIDEYIKSLYKGDNSKEVRELKEELREHLILSANELVQKDMMIEKSQKIAIEKFDGGEIC